MVDCTEIGHAFLLGCVHCAMPPIALDLEQCCCGTVLNRKRHKDEGCLLLSCDLEVADSRIPEQPHPLRVGRMVMKGGPSWAGDEPILAPAAGMARLPHLPAIRRSAA